MRKLIPVFIITSIVAFAGGNAVAAMGDSTTSTDRATGSPTVDANTNDSQGLSYGDKSNISPGTNAKMNHNPAGTAAYSSPDVSGNAAMNDANTKKKHRKAKVAADTDTSLSTNPPTGGTNASAVNSVTGTSGGK